MRAWTRGAWRSGLLDAHRPPGRVRLKVYAWAPLMSLHTDPSPPRDARRLLGYVRKVGPRRVARKVASRLRGARAGGRWLAIGVGDVLEAPAGAALEPGQTVVFVAPRHLRCQERVVLAPELMRPWPRHPGRLREPGRVWLMEQAFGADPALEALAGWSPEAGAALEDREAALDAACALLVELAARPARPARGGPAGADPRALRPGPGAALARRGVVRGAGTTRAPACCRR